MSKYNEAFPVSFEGKNYFPTKSGWMASDNGQVEPILPHTNEGQQILEAAKSEYDFLSLAIINSILDGNYDAQTEVTA